MFCLDVLRIWFPTVLARLIDSFLDHTLDLEPIHKKAIIQQFVISPDSCHVLAISQQGVLYVWSFFTGQLIQTLVLGRQARALALSPNGRYLYTSTIDGPAYVSGPVIHQWTINHQMIDETSKRPLDALSLPFWSHQFLCVSQDGQWLITDSLDHAGQTFLQQWNIKFQHVFCKRFGKWRQTIALPVTIRCITHITLSADAQFVFLATQTRDQQDSIYRIDLATQDSLQVWHPPSPVTALYLSTHTPTLWILCRTGFIVLNHVTLGECTIPWAPTDELFDLGGLAVSANETEAYWTCLPIEFLKCRKSKRIHLHRFSFKSLSHSVIHSTLSTDYFDHIPSPNLIQSAPNGFIVFPLHGSQLRVWYHADFTDHSIL